MQAITRSQSQGSAHLRRDHEAALLSKHECGIHGSSVAHVRGACQVFPIAVGYRSGAPSALGPWCATRNRDYGALVTRQDRAPWWLLLAVAVVLGVAAALLAGALGWPPLVAEGLAGATCGVAAVFVLARYRSNGQGSGPDGQRD